MGITDIDITQPIILNEDNLKIDHNTVEFLHKITDPLPVSMILVDGETRIRMINKQFLDFLGVTREEAIGRKVVEINKNSRFPFVMKSKKPEIAWKHTFANGETAIVHRIPVLNQKGKVVYGFGMILFGDMEEFQDIVIKNKLLETKVSHYKEILKKIQGAYYNWDTIIGNSKSIANAKLYGKKAAKTGSNVLIVGESGTGKELFAHAIHGDSKRNHQPFIKVNCGAIPHDLLESELFGYDEGAFTGARKGGKVGKFELAEGGSIFLDEIGDMPHEMQVKLLRVLQEKEFERVGGIAPIKADVRIIAATNQDLKSLVEEGKFREDLYYRLNVMMIEVPPLRDRMDDIELLVKSLLDKLTYKLGSYVEGISEDALEMIKTYKWPGNVRELENILERAINLVDEGYILLEHLPKQLLNKDETLKISSAPIEKLSERIERTEKEAIIQCLEYTKGNKQKTAELLGISRSNLYGKIEKYQITV
ncbi:sigma-54 interaction domain-containing protein [Alkaliphilus transvaalensis]|uniref:sigma-54 interaction domain-containing protein n=1 Tax=Alkaliphilus transvaalensis TaxID=114628 RepID=UPI0009FBBC4C|nr:sigma 54-interacting transcriptional regulator [Alkaliphilus transvaalensis]